MKMYVPGIKTFILGKYGSLLVALVTLMVLQPTIDTTIGKYLLEVMFIAVLIAGLRAIEIKKSLLRFECVLLFVSLVLNATGILLGHDGLFFLGLACRAFFLLLVALTILADLFRSRKVEGDTLAGAVCVYLLIALVFSYGFLLIEVFMPGSFSFTQGQSRVQLWVSKEFFPFFYFSLVTMTTVGYGDMSPVTTVARTFASMEAIIGQLYLTILVARLVGMYLVVQQDKEG
ncbi:MAG: hypothetical protein KAU27_14525 [Desulfuromonadales bacterium]|nr:hypothetical protein [Desulfuromonadales bacterium]